MAEAGADHSVEGGEKIPKEQHEWDNRSNQLNPNHEQYQYPNGR